MSTEEKNVTQEKPVKKQAEFKETNETLTAYNRFIELKFIKLDGGKLTENAEKDFLALEKDVKERKGKKPVRTVTAAFGNKTIKLCEGIAVPKEISDFIENAGHSKYYFG